jgi:Holliday junction resolvase
VRRAARRDDNHADIVRALRQCGCNVLDLGAVGNGCPDLLVSFAGVLSLLEVKDGAGPPSSRNLTADQNDFHREHAEARIAVVTTPEEAIQAATILTEGP